MLVSSSNRCGTYKKGRGLLAQHFTLIFSTLTPAYLLQLESVAAHVSASCFVLSTKGINTRFTSIHWSSSDSWCKQLEVPKRKFTIDLSSISSIPGRKKNCDFTHRSKLWIALAVATNSSAWLGTAVLVTNMRNFPLSRGTVAGILKGYVGLSAAVVTELYTMVLKGSATALLLSFTLGIPVICLSLMYYVRPCTPASESDPSENTHFLFTQGASVVLAVFLLTTTILKDTMDLSNTLSYTFVAIMVVLLLAPLAIPVKMTLFPAKKKLNRVAGSIDSLITDPLLTPVSSDGNLLNLNDGMSEVDVLLAVGESAIKFKKKRRPRRGEDFTFREAVVKADFWILWLVNFLGVGSGVTVLNNLAQIGLCHS